GNYAMAIAHFREGVRRCGKLGRAAHPQCCYLWLNIALLHKAQGDLGEALAACREARAVHELTPARDGLVAAALDAAAASLHAAAGHLKEADRLAGKVLEACAKRGEERGPLVMTARHCQALFRLYCRDFPGADNAWREVDRLHGDRSPLRPRTLNYRAL